MSIRWLLILLVVLWLVYEYTTKFWIKIWQIDSKTLKCGVGICIILLLVCLPSIEDTVSNVNVNDFLYKILVNDSYTQHYTSRDEIQPNMLQKMQMGADIATAS